MRDVKVGMEVLALDGLDALLVQRRGKLGGVPTWDVAIATDGQAAASEMGMRSAGALTCLPRIADASDGPLPAILACVAEPEGQPGAGISCVGRFRLRRTPEGTLEGAPRPASPRLLRWLSDPNRVAAIMAHADRHPKVDRTEMADLMGGIVGCAQAAPWLAAADGNLHARASTMLHHLAGAGGIEKATGTRRGSAGT